jgi:hypothetical protein
MQDFRGQYFEQLTFLRNAATGYDGGFEPEAKNLALRVRVMVHDKGRSRSLLSHLGLKGQMPFRDTALADPAPGVITLDGGLCTFQFLLDTPGKIAFKAPRDDLSVDRMHPPACFDDWWLRPVLHDAAGNAFARRDLVLSVCDQDGGAHIDAKLNPKYAALTRSNSLGFGQSGGEQPNSAVLTFGFEGLNQVADIDEDDAEPLSNSIALASVRQVAHELISTLEHEVVDHGSGLELRAPICPIPWHEAPDAERNAPCPCGSGRKFKHCFGRREPRRRGQLPVEGAP